MTGTKSVPTWNHEGRPTGRLLASSLVPSVSEGRL